MKHLLPILLTALLAPAALAHDMPLDHAHPHPDVSLMAVLALIGVAVGLGALAYKVLQGVKKGKDNDPR